MQLTRVVVVLARVVAVRLTVVYEKFFQKSSEKHVICCVLQVKLSFHGGRSSIKEHLKCKHPVEDPFQEVTSQHGNKRSLLSFQVAVLFTWKGSDYQQKDHASDCQGLSLHQLDYFFFRNWWLTLAYIPSTLWHPFHPPDLKKTCSSESRGMLPAAAWDTLCGWNRWHVE